MTSNISNTKSQISFHVNGKLQTIKDEYPLTTSLNFFLRNVLKLTGTKVYCHEGGCGACVVHAKVFDHTSSQYQDVSVNSCLFPLYSCDGYSFTTVEGLGDLKNGLHPIQKRLADKNGSQCGYCSPGFVMNMYSKLKNNPRPSQREIEDSLDGNICRCTGYRAIIDAMKTFSVDQSPIDIEDLSKELKCLNKDYDHNCHNQNSDKTLFHVQKDNKDWYSPANLDDLKSLMSKYKSSRIRYVNGNTSIGVYKKSGPFDLYINLKSVKDLYECVKSDTEIRIGSNLSITNLMNLFKDLSNKDAKNYGHLNELAESMKKIANVHVRNIASWAGNLVIKKQHPEFTSDMLVLLELTDTKLNVYDLNTAKTDEISIKDYLSAENNYFIESLCLRPFDQEKVRVKFYKVSHRSFNSHAYVNLGIRFTFEDKNSSKLSARPLVLISGIDSKFINATKTEDFLINQDISDKRAITTSIDILKKEIDSSGIKESSNDPLLPSVEFRTNLALSLFYKGVLCMSKLELKPELKSACESIQDTRNLQSFEQIFEQKDEMNPLTKPMPKLNAYSQTTGETKYVDDLSTLSLQTHGAFVLSTIASGRIDSIDLSKALSVPGVINIYLAKDIPGINNIMPSPFPQVEPLFASDEVSYCGQPIGLVVAETHEIAKKASKLVIVNYKDVKKPILTIQDAIKQNSFHPKPSCGDLIKGNSDEAIKNSKHVISGEFFQDSSQFNFYLEGIISNTEPTEDGYKIECTTQWIDSVQRSVSMVLGIENSSCIDVQVKQIGGGFGGKTTRANIVSCASTLAAYHLRRPVKIHMDLNDCMDIVGKRPPWLLKYKVGFDDDGKLNGIDYEWYSDPGYVSNGSVMFACFNFFDNAYKCDNYNVRPFLCKTNKPASTEVRSPDVVSSYCVTEHVLEHIANYLNKDPLKVRQVNFFKKGDKTANEHSLPYIDIDKVVNDLVDSSEFYKRKQEIDEFNRLNRFKKRGIALIPVRYCLTYNLGYYNALVSIRHHDGSVSISHGGIEMGQGIHTKVAQVCAHELGIPIEKISVKTTNNLVNPNILWTGGSVTSELCAKSVIGACEILKKELEPVRKLMHENYTWNELVSKAFSMNCNLSAMYLQRPGQFDDLMTYDIDAASCTEVIIDLLTGETQVLRTDILYDCGQSMNGLIDIGQAEGGFVMGLGYILLERTIYDPETGKCLNNGTWEYKPPLAKDTPIDFRIKFVHNKPNPVGVLGSKATGEPPLILCNSVLYAVRHAIEAARRERGVEGHFVIDLPASIEKVQQACLVNINELSF